MTLRLKIKMNPLDWLLLMGFMIIVSLAWKGHASVAIKALTEWIKLLLTKQ